MSELRRLRRLAGWTQHELSRRAKVGRDRISLAETGQLQLTPQEQVAIRQALLRAIADRIREGQAALGVLARGN